MYRFRTIILETSYVNNNAELAIEVDRLVADALEQNGNCQLVNVQTAPLGIPEGTGVAGIWMIFLYTVEVLEGTPVPQESTQGV